MCNPRHNIIRSLFFSLGCCWCCCRGHCFRCVCLVVPVREALELSPTAHNEKGKWSLSTLLLPSATFFFFKETKMFTWETIPSTAACPVWRKSARVPWRHTTSCWNRASWACDPSRSTSWMPRRPRWGAWSAGLRTEHPLWGSKDPTGRRWCTCLWWAGSRARWWCGAPPDTCPFCPFSCWSSGRRSARSDDGPPRRPSFARASGACGGKWWPGTTRRPPEARPSRWWRSRRSDRPTDRDPDPWPWEKRGPCAECSSSTGARTAGRRIRAGTCTGTGRLGSDKFRRWGRAGWRTDPPRRSNPFRWIRAGRCTCSRWSSRGRRLRWRTAWSDSRRRCSGTEIRRIRAHTGTWTSWPDPYKIRRWGTDCPNNRWYPSGTCRPWIRPDRCTWIRWPCRRKIRRSGTGWWRSRPPGGRSWLRRIRADTDTCNRYPPCRDRWHREGRDDRRTCAESTSRTGCRGIRWGSHKLHWFHDPGTSSKTFNFKLSTTAASQIIF